MSDKDRFSKLGEHIQSAIMLASQLNLVLPRQLLSMVWLALMEARPAFDDAPADVPVKSFNSGSFRIVGSWDWDLVADRVYADAEVAELYGVPVLDAEQGTSVQVYLPRIFPEDLERVTMLLERARRTGGAYRATYRLMSPNGEKNILAVGRVVLDADRRAIRFPGTVIEMQAGAGQGHSSSESDLDDSESLTGEPRWRIE